MIEIKRSEGIRLSLMNYLRSEISMRTRYDSYVSPAVVGTTYFNNSYTSLKYINMWPTLLAVVLLMRFHKGLSSSEENAEVKLGMVYFGEISDVGWTYQHNDGMIAAREALERRGISIYSEVYELVKPSQSITLFEQLASRNFSLVIGTSFSFRNQIFNASKYYPNTNFLHVSGIDSGVPNFKTAFGKLYQSRYLAGIAAGGTSKTGKIGYVASIPIPEVMRSINSFFFGAREINPNVTLIVTWVNTFYDESREEEAARRLVHLGCDVVGYHTDSRAVPRYMARRKLFSVGSNSDMRRIIGESILLSAYFNWGKIYEDMMYQSYTKTFSLTSPSLWYDHAQGVAVASMPSFNVPKIVSSEIALRSQKMTHTSFDPFCPDDRPPPIEFNTLTGCPSELQILTEISTIPNNVNVKDIGDVQFFGELCPPGTRYIETIIMDTSIYNITCVPCQPGEFSFFEGVEGVSNCSKCLPGTFSTDSESSVCLPCSIGFYAPTPGLSLCHPCPSDYTNNIPGSLDCPIKNQSKVLIGVLAGVCSAFFIIALIFTWRYTRNARRMALLHSNNCIAERCAESIAAMRLEEVEYIKKIQRPNRIQLAFITIVENLIEYRRYLPQSIVDGASDVSSEEVVKENSPLKQDNSEQQQQQIEIVSSFHNVSTKGSCKSLKSLKSGSASRKSFFNGQLAAQLDLGVRSRKSSILLVDFSHPVRSGVASIFEVSASFTTDVLAAVAAIEGTILEMRGDGCLSVWNAFKPSPRHVFRACNCAINVNKKLSSRKFENRFSIIVSTGMVAVGHFGDLQRRAPFVFGVPVAQGRRMLSLSDKLGCHVFCSEKVHEAANSQILMRPIDVIQDIDMASKISIFELVDIKDELSLNNDSQYSEYLFAFNKFVSGDCCEALELLKGLQTEGHVRRLVTHCEQIIATNPDHYWRKWVGWDGEKVSCAEPREVTCAVVSPKNRRQSEALRSDIKAAAAKKENSDSDYSTESSASQQIPERFVDREGCGWNVSNVMLGSGGNGEVWKGMGDDGSLVAMKSTRMPKEQQPARKKMMSQSTDPLKDLLVEVSMLSKLVHENIVSIISTAVVGHTVILIMELVPGGSLMSVLDQFGTLHFEPLRRYSRDILRGLHFLHSEGVIHRDLKPANVLLLIDGQAKLADFGAAAEISKGSTLVLGTPQYMAPEACRGEAVKKSDVWSFGIALLQLITGKMPWGDDVPTNSVAFTRQLSKNEGMMPEIPTELDSSYGGVQILEMISKCLTRSPDLRIGVDALLTDVVFLK